MSRKKLMGTNLHISVQCFLKMGNCICWDANEFLILSRSAKNKEIPPLENKVAYIREKKSFFNLPYRSHDCSRTCLMKTPLTFKGENPLQLPIKCHFQRRHAKTNSHSSALHVSYKTPCGRSLRNVEEVFRYLLETECNYLFTDNFSFNTYVQLTRNYPKQEEIVSDVDISNGVESVPISFCNEIDNRKLPHFKYRRTVWPRAYYLTSFSNMFTDSCDCSEGCIDMWVENMAFKKIFWTKGFLSGSPAMYQFVCLNSVHQKSTVERYTLSLAIERKIFPKYYNDLKIISSEDEYFL